MITNKYDEELQVFTRWWGLGTETVLAMEECAELIQELSKSLRQIKRTDNLAEEMADVYLMIREIEMAMGLEAQVNMYMDQKVERIWKRMIDEKEMMGDDNAISRDIQAIKKPDSQ